MPICIYCSQFKSQVNEDGICPKCQDDNIPPPISFTRKGVGIIPKTSRGLILSREQWLRIVRQAEKFYNSTTSDWIDGRNSDLRFRLLDEQKSKARLKGYVYLLQSPRSMYKIGRTGDVKKRLLAIKREYPIKIRLIHSFYCDDSVKVESYLHMMFYEQQLQGDWFRLSDEQVEWIKTVDQEKASHLL